ncbi:MAG: exo-alpha-sialidase [SAR202 cluster bacterium]|nr:exo-alpha-sialidase [SAR202 cluster bacterium]
MVQAASVHSGDVLVMVGTKKGSFLLTSDASREHWRLSGPYNPGAEVFHLAWEPRSSQLLAAANHAVWGPHVEYSNDLGASWHAAKQDPAFPLPPELLNKIGGPTWNTSDQPPRFAAEGETLKKVWHLEPGRVESAGTIYAGVEPAALFKSTDGGKTWQEVSGLTQHPSRSQWHPGAGGLCLHSIVPHPTDPKRMWVGISAAGVFGTSDGGKSWQPLNKGVRADFQPDRYPEFGQCVHKLLVHPARPETLYQQNHCGVYRSDDGGRQWHDISEGLPSRFGYVLGLHSQDPDTLYVVPEDTAVGDEGGGINRYVSDAKFRVYRSRNKGQDWQALTHGLPQHNAYLHTLREGMATDRLDPCGIYVGTVNGQVFYSRDDGDHWETLIEYLLPINSVSCSMVE